MRLEFSPRLLAVLRPRLIRIEQPRARAILGVASLFELFTQDNANRMFVPAPTRASLEFLSIKIWEGRPKKNPRHGRVQN